MTKDTAGTAQLDLLLLKAESYSKFILENQKRAQAIISTTEHLTTTKPISPSVAKESPTFLQPPNMVGGSLMPHQLEGLQWLLSLWENGLNGILADEMGLGKTIQIISLIAHLRSHNTAGPYLIAGPLATLGNWMKEFNRWLPSCPVILYHGTKAEREQIRKSRMPLQLQKSLDFPVIITSFELCIADRAFLEKYVWQYIILDEGHRIKNRNCRLLRELKSLKSVSRLLLTGTPIQNSLEELWSLLNFCSPAIFDDLEIFQSWFDFKNIGHDTKVDDILGEETNSRVISKLHEILRPFVLRRLKTETMGHLVPAKKEIVIYCGMSKLQKEYYAHVMSNTLRDTLVSSGIPYAHRMSQLNQLMNYRKVCNHPFLFGDVLDIHGVPLRDSNPAMLVAASGKFRVLDRLLTRLKHENRKVIIFSQMTEVLNLIEDYFHHQQYAYERLDGMTKLTERQDSIDRFNVPDSDVFAFLLSTRAGGLGINLTAADTAILFDSDWNPHVDAQAQDRCHRIGQTKNVVVYRLLTIGSVELDMMEKQISKKKLERLTISGGDFRKAGQRSSSTTITIDDIRRLLEDDLNLQHTEKNKNGDGDWLGQEISEDELDLIMCREGLFGQDHVVDGYGSGCEEETGNEDGEEDRDREERQENIYETIETKQEKKKKKTVVGKKGSVKKASKKRGHAELEEEEEEEEVMVVGVLEDRKKTKQLKKEQKVFKTVPKEGIMYDIVNTNFGTELLSLS